MNPWHDRAPDCPRRKRPFQRGQEWHRLEWHGLRWHGLRWHGLRWRWLGWHRLRALSCLLVPSLLALCLLALAIGDATGDAFADATTDAIGEVTSDVTGGATADSTGDVTGDVISGVTSHVIGLHSRDPAAPRILLADTGQGIGSITQFDVFEDPGQDFDLDAVLALPEGLWQANPYPAIQVGFSASAWWVRFSLTNQTGQDQRRVLQVDWPLLDWVDLYQLHGAGVVGSWQTGDQRPFATRPLETRDFAFPLYLPAGETHQILLRLALSDGLFRPMALRLWEVRAFQTASQWGNVLGGAYCGALLALLLYHLLLFFSTWHRNFLFYALYLALMLFWNLGLLGYGYQYLWPDQSWWNNQFNLLLSWLASLGGTLFVVHFLDTRRRTPVVHRLILGLTALMTLPVLVKVASYAGWSPPLAPVYGGYLFTSWVLVLAYLVAGVHAVRQGFRPARWFVLAWSFLFLGVLVNGLGYLPGLIPHNLWTANGLNIGSTLEIILLALALGSRFNLLRDDKLAAERRAAELQAAHAATLEREVDERTRELRQAMTQVQTALDQERRVQAELREFLATVSHELRTPLAVIDTIAQNLELDGAQADEETRTRYHQIQQVTARMSHLLDGYLEEERFTLLRPGAEPVLYDPRLLLEDAAQAARVLAEGQRLRVEAEGMPPTCRCDPELTRLALHNLADNAVKYTPPGTQVVLRGQRAGRRASDGIWLDVIDDGPGLDPAALAGLFEPLARGPTAVGKPGKGLGLYLARRLIQTQGGTLTVTSEPGQGCRFRIWLPG